VRIQAEIEHGKPLVETSESALMPSEVLEDHELVYRVRRAPEAEAGDLLIVEPRATAATGELVLVTRGQNAYLGHWWAKHGCTELRENSEKPLTGKFQILGAVNLIVRRT
jgi:hypothetical protein